MPTAWIENGNPWGISAEDGTFFLDFTSYTNVGTYGGVMQSFATTPGTSYTVSFELGYGGTSPAFAGPVTIDVSAGGSSETFTSGSGTPNPAVWDAETFHFTANSSITTLSIIGTSTADGSYIGLDNVDVELASGATVPEPATATLLFTGMALLGFAARRQIKA